MNRNVPFKIDYDLIKSLEKFASIILVISALISTCVLIIEKNNFAISKETVIKILNASLGIISVVYFLLDIVQNYLFYKAEINRKNDFIDNSLNTKLSDKNSNEYFSNDNLEPGFFKLGVNAFENSFFSKMVSKSMIPKKIITSCLFVLLFLLVIFCTDQSTIISLFQIVLPFSVLQQTYKLYIFNSRINTVFDKFKFIFSNLTKETQTALFVENIINYEKTLSWGGILLDSKKFDELNPVLSSEWEDIKKRFGI